MTVSELELTSTTFAIALTAVALPAALILGFLAVLGAIYAPQFWVGHTMRRHGAERPDFPGTLIDAVAAAVMAGADAVVPGIPVADTLKQVDEAGRVNATVDRSSVRAVQTPQGFARAVLEEAHVAGAVQAGDEAMAATDDAGLVEGLGRTVMVVPGSEEAFKVTRPLDLVLAEAVLARRRAGGARGGR